MAGVEWLDRAFYPEVESNWDDKLFRRRILHEIRDGARTVLDLGAGAGYVAEMNFKDHVSEIVGIDPDPRVLDNPYLHSAYVGFGNEMPFSDGRFDLVFADNVLEHLVQPEEVFAEVHRVLKPGGVFLAKTPNRAHYVPTIARLTPLWFHQRVNRWRGRGAEDVFPTLYRANDPGTIRSLARQAGFTEVAFDLVESRPEYLRMATLPYLFGIIWERTVNLTRSLRGFRVLLVARLTK